MKKEQNRFNTSKNLKNPNRPFSFLQEQNPSKNDIVLKSP